MYNRALGRSGIHHARGRSIGALGGYAVGVLLASAVPNAESMVWMSIACGLVAALILLPARLRPVLWNATALLAIVCLSAGFTQLRTLETPADRLDAMVFASRSASSEESIPIEVRAVLLDQFRTTHTEPEPGDPPTWSHAKTEAHARIERVYMRDPQGRGSWIRASGIVRVLIADPGDRTGQSMRAGDRVEILGLFSPVGNARNLGDLDWSRLSAQSARVGSLTVRDESMMTPAIDQPAGFFDRLNRSRMSLQASIRARAMGAIGLDGAGLQTLNTDAPPQSTQERAMLGALLLGQRDPSFGQVYESFQRVGVAHVLAISGFHLALVILMGVLGLRVLGEYPKTQALIVMLILLAGMVVLPMRPPIVRAGLIVMVLMIAGSMGRRYDRLTVLAWIGLGLLIWRPMDVYSLGYQLSMGMTGLLILLADTQQRRKQSVVLDRQSFSLHQQPKRAGVLGALANATRVNVACWLVALPTILFHTGIVSLLAPLVSLALIPMVIVLMAIGYMQITIGMVAPGLGERTMGVVDWAAHSVQSFVVWVDQLPGSSVWYGQLGPVWTLLATGVLGAIVLRPSRLKHKTTIGAAIALALWVIVGPMVLRERAALRLDMLDVGDGSCVLIQSAGEGLIWDCGSLDFRVGESAARTARASGLHRVRDAIVTHDNLDHYNGLLALSNQLGLERVWVSPRMIGAPSKTWSDYQARLMELGIEIRTLSIDQTIRVGDVELVCLWPDPQAMEGLGDNDTSIVVQILVPNSAGSGVGTEPTSVLLTGDIERPAMNAILDRTPELSAHIIELPHHGSAKPGATGFVDRLDPSIVLQSTGPTRLDDPRWASTRAGRTWYATANKGGVWVRIMRDGTVTHGWARE